MICYLDSSAFVKRYLEEPGGIQVRQLIADAEALGSVDITRVEVVAALGKAVRLGAITLEHGEASRRFFQTEWRDLSRVEITDHVLERAADLAWSHGLRGYDSVQLAAAMIWQDRLGFSVTLAAFDVKLWEAAARVGLEVYPAKTSRILERLNRASGKLPPHRVPPRRDF
ncbi:MAG TPA: type II toxin-antitoxin system VapC family toxin [Thermoanaerobaculia bacterium]|nr:type II toxin-antitoxin system VapC family toxin [Thermoanaerobaculia bacterium]